jgi:hypothetical protein
LKVAVAEPVADVVQKAGVEVELYEAVIEGMLTLTVIGLKF